MVHFHAVRLGVVPTIRSTRTLLVFLAALLSGSAAAESAILIHSVYAGGFGGTGTYSRDYVVLVNRSTSPASLNGLHLQSASAVGTFASVPSNILSLPDVTLQPGQFYLIECGPGGSSGASVPQPDLTTTSLSLTNGSGKVALTNTATELGGGSDTSPIPLPDPRILDLVAYGVSNNAEGGAPAGNGEPIPDTQAIRRKQNALGHIQDTDNNHDDFELIIPTGINAPFNSSSPFATVPVALSGFALD